MNDLIDRMYKHPIVTCMLIAAIGSAAKKILRGVQAITKNN